MDILTLSEISGALKSLAQPMSPVNDDFRPGAWAFRVPAANMWRLNHNLYRSARPKPEQWPVFESMGIKKFICLAEPPDKLDGTKFVQIYRPMPSGEVNMRALQCVMDELRDSKERNMPTLVHCQHGADRTGLVCAVYRIIHDGWSPLEAVSEMQFGGFGYHPIWSDLVRFVIEGKYKDLIM